MLKISKSIRTGLWLSLVGMASSAHAEDTSEFALSAAPAGTLEDYIREPEVRSISMSPDGKKLALIKRVAEEKYQLLTLDIANGIKPIARLDEPKGQKIKRVKWLNNERLGMSIEKERTFGSDDHHYTGVNIVDPDGKNSVAVKGNVSLGAIIAILPDIHKYVYMSASTVGQRNRDEDVCLLRVNVYSGKVWAMQCGNKRTYNFSVSDDGAPAYRFDYFNVARRVDVFAYNRVSDEWGLIAQVDVPDEDYDDDDDEDEKKLRARIASFDGDTSMFVLERKGMDEFRKIHRLDAKTQEYIDVALEIDGIDIRAALFDPDTGKIVGAEYITDKQEYKYFEPRLQRINDYLEPRFPNSSIFIKDASKQNGNVLFHTISDWRPGSFYLYNDKTKKIMELADVAPQLRAKMPNAVEQIDYKTSDGLKIESYLTRPANRRHEKLPLIVMPHGGPGSSNWKAYDTYAHYWASRGYAVFQPNFRGSTERGRTFEQAGYHEFGGKMIDDIADGIHMLINQGLVDADRICSAGISYGGYASLMLAIRTDLLKCAVSINGPTDWRYRIQKISDDADSLDHRLAWRAWADKAIGNINERPELFESMSAVARAGEVTGAVLLIHSVDDRNVRLAHATKMNSSLKHFQKDVRFVKLKKGGHSIRDDDAKEKLFKETTRFFEKHLK